VRSERRASELRAAARRRPDAGGGAAGRVDERRCAVDCIMRAACVR
jgi:hypothetical protein